MAGTEREDGGVGREFLIGRWLGSKWGWEAGSWGVRQRLPSLRDSGPLPSGRLGQPWEAGFKAHAGQSPPSPSLACLFPCPKFACPAFSSSRREAWLLWIELHVFWRRKSG